LAARVNAKPLIFDPKRAFPWLRQARAAIAVFPFR
jgi:hypothetical protein